MKKRIIGIACVCAVAALSLTACGGNKTYGKLNSLIAKTPSEAELVVTVTADGETLSGEYSLSEQDGGYVVEYTYERLSTFDASDDGYIFPDAVKTTYEGSVVVKDGKIVQQNGDTADLTFEQMTASGVKFDETYFSNVVIDDGSVIADVSDPEAFLQSDITCTDMQMKVLFTDDAITSLTVSYTSAAGAQVVIEYTFG